MVDGSKENENSSWNRMVVAWVVLVVGYGVLRYGLSSANTGYGNSTGNSLVL